MIFIRLALEACQNSLDATIDHDENPTLIRFAYKELENNEFFLKYINNLIPKLNCMGSLKNQLSNDEKSNLDFLIIEDLTLLALLVLTILKIILMQSKEMK